MKIPIKKLIFSSGGFVIAFGIVFFTIMLTSNLSDLTNAMLRFEVPTKQSLDLMPGTYTIYHEYKTFFKNTRYDQEDMSLDGLNFELLDSENNPIQIVASSGYSNYSFNHRNGYSIAEFTIEDSGIYDFDGHFENDSDKKIVCTIGRGVFESLFKTITMSVLVLITCFVAGFTMIMRKIYKSKNR